MSDIKQLFLSSFKSLYDLAEDQLNDLEYNCQEFVLGDDIHSKLLITDDKRVILLKGKVRLLQKIIDQPEKTVLILMPGDILGLQDLSSLDNHSLIGASNDGLVCIINQKVLKQFPILENNWQNTQNKIQNCQQNQSLKLKGSIDILTTKTFKPIESLDQALDKILLFYGVEGNISRKPLSNFTELINWLESHSLAGKIQAFNSFEIINIKCPFLLQNPQDNSLHWIINCIGNNLIEDSLDGKINQPLLISDSNKKYQVLQIHKQEIRKISSDQEPYSWSWYLGLFQENTLLSLQMIFSSILIQISALGVPFLYMVIFDRVFGRHNHDTLNVIAIGMILISLFELTVKFIRIYVLAYQSELLDRSSFKTFIERLFSVPVAKLNRDLARSYMQCFNELGKINQSITQTLFVSCLDVFFSIIVFFVLLTLSASLTLISLAPIIPIIIIILYTNYFHQASSNESLKEKSSSQAKLNEALTGIETVKTLNATHFLKQNILNQIEESFKKSFNTRTDKMNESAILAWIASLGSLAVLYFGAKDVLDQKITFGIYMAINMLSRTILTSLQGFASSLFKFREALESNNKLKSLYYEENEFAHEGIFVDSILGKISLNNINFRYQEDEPWVLKNINLKLKPGEKIVLLGKSGAGKTSLVRLLQRLYLPNAGYIQLDNYNLADLNLYSLRQQIGVAIQKPTIFAGTVKDNIMLANPSSSMKDLLEAISFVQLDQFLAKQVQGLNTPLASMGSNLSGGQIALISLARLFLIKPSVLIFDEAFSALDPSSSSIIINRILQKFKNETCIFISDYLPLHQQANKIIILNEGEIIETGSHSELVKNRGYYYHLYPNQE